MLRSRCRRGCGCRLAGCGSAGLGPGLQLLRELIPNLACVAVLASTPATDPFSGPFVDDLRSAATSAGLRLEPHLKEAYGADARDRYWEILEALRSELGYVDYLGALEPFRVEAMHRPDVLRMSSWLVDYPFADRLYPAAWRQLGEILKPVRGPAVIPSDGDAVFQPRKVERRPLAGSGRSCADLHPQRRIRTRIAARSFQSGDPASYAKARYSHIPWLGRPLGKSSCSPPP